MYAEKQKRKKSDKWPVGPAKKEEQTGRGHLQN